MAANMYRVGDYVFFETSSTTPYQIRRIEELNKTPNGNVEAKVMCFYRRRDISSSLILLADKHQSDLEEERDENRRRECEERRQILSRLGALSDGHVDSSDALEDDLQDVLKARSSGKAKDSPNDDLEDDLEDVQKEGSSEKAKEATPDALEDEREGSPKPDSDKENEKTNSIDNDKTNSIARVNSSKEISGALDDPENESCIEELGEKHRHQLKHRELFLSRQVETLPATHIRGKCAVTLLNETESLLSYLNKDDAFFYSLVYDPQQKTLLADKGEIRVGSRYQAEVGKRLNDPPAEDTRRLEDLEVLMWSPENRLSDRHIDQFMVVARSVGTFARALDCTSTVRQPSLHMSAAAASRDVTLFHAMDTLHRHTYDSSRAIASLVPPGGPVLCRDEMEEWSASEANLFEEALDKYGKDFNDIRQDFLPWKSLKSIVEYYYMWKTTDRYVQQKRIKAAEAETKLKQVYIPNYNKPNPAQITNKMNGADGTAGRACESCYTAHSNQWFAWGPIHMNCRLCSTCWNYWKKYGGLKMPTRLDNTTPPASGFYEQNGDSKRLAHLAAMRLHRCTIGGCGKEFKLKAQLARHLATAHGLAIRAGSPRPVMKTRAAFCLITTPLTRLSRQVCHDILRISQAARQPFHPINIAAIKQECQVRMPNHMNGIKPLYPRKRPAADIVLARLGIDTKQKTPPLLQVTESGRKEATRLSFPKPTGEGRPAPAMLHADPEVPRGSPNIMLKRGYEQTNGLDAGPKAKRPMMGVIRQAGNARQNTPMMRDTVINQLNGRGAKGSMGRTRKQVLNWIDAPDDVYFVSTDATRKLRKQMSQLEFRRAARKPWRKLNVKLPGSLTTAEPIVIE